MKTKKILFGSTLLAAAAMSFCAASVAFADDPTPGSVTGSGDGDTYTDDTNGGTTTIGTVITDYDYYIKAKSTTTTTGGTLSDYTQFRGIGTLINGTVGGFVLQYRTSMTGDPSAISGSNVYFTGTSEEGTDQLTITGINIDNNDTGAPFSTSKSFIVENCKVIIDGGTEGLTASLGMNLCIGTMADAELVITNGAKITTGAYYSTVGSNGATGTITVSGEGSTLSTQQISLGMSVFSLSAYSGTSNGDYFAQYLESDDERNAVISAILSGSASGEGYTGSYGIVNVENGAVWYFGPTVGETKANSAQSKLQLANGEINIKGGVLVLGEGSGLTMMGESSIVGVTWDEEDQQYVYDTTKVAEGVMLSQTINVTDGGKIYSTGNGGVFEVAFGDSWVGSKDTTTVTVDGEGSSFDVYVGTQYYESGYIGVYFGGYRGYWNAGLGAQYTDGGTEDTTISATNGGVFKVKTEGNIYAAADNYLNYVDDPQYTNITAGSTIGHSYGLNVDFTAETGGTIDLEAAGNVILGGGSPYEADADSDGVNDYTNTLTITADGTLTDEDGNVTASSITISGGDIYTNFGDAGEGSDNVYVEITATNGGAITLTAGDNSGISPDSIMPYDDDGEPDEHPTGNIVFNKNTTITVDEDSTLNTTGAVSFNAGASLLVNAGGSWTSSGSVTVAEGASMDLSGTIDLSEAIQNSGSVTVNSYVVFVLSDSLLVEGSSATYAIIINGDSGTITNWDSDTLGLTNFVYADGEALSDVVLDLSTAGYVKLLTSQGGVVIDYDYKTPWQRGDHGLSGYIAAGKDLYYFEAIKFDVSGVNATNFTLQDANETAITNKNVYIVGNGKDSSKLTITSAKIDNGDYGDTHGTHNSFIVEGCTVIFDGKASANDGTSQLVIADLGMNLSIGTKADAELQITGGAQVTTSAYLSTVGANLATGTITISGEGSVLDNQQITLGSATNSMFGIALSTKEGESNDGEYWIQYVETDDDYNTVITAITSDEYDPTKDGSYGIVNIKDGGTWQVGVGSTNYSQSKLQLSNGEINVDGAGSQLLLGGQSCLTVMGENMINGEQDVIITGIKYSEKITVTNGGKITNYTNPETGDPDVIYQVTLGNLWYASNDVVTVLVSGSDDDGNASTFDLTASYSAAACIGSNAGNWSTTEAIDGGTQNVTITAEKGGVFKLSQNGGIFVAADSYMHYIYGGSASTTGASYGLTVSLTAESGGSLTLESDKDEIILGSGSPATKDANGDEADYTNTVTITANGEGSSVLLSAALNITANREDADAVYVTFTATDGGTMTISADEGTILNKNTKVIVDEDSTLNTTGAVSFNAGSSLTVNAGGTWTSSGSVTVAEGASMSLNGTIDLSNQIQNSGEITVGDSVVFLLKEDDVNFKDEDEHFNFTYDFIINTEADDATETEGGTIKGWDTLTIGNFSIVASDENNEVPENLGIVTKADGQATVVFVTTDETNGGTATVDYDYYIEYVSGRGLSGKFYCIGITVDGTVDSFVLQDRTSITGDLEDITKAITSKDVLFIGSGATDADGNLVDSVTITGAKISNTGSSTNAFAVEGCTVIIDGQASENEGKSQIVIDELGMSLNIGTMYGAGDAELVITNGSNITTSAYYNTVGSNLNTGTITVEESSTLATQQITLGGGVDSLFACNPDKAGQYQTYYFYDSDTYATIRAKIVSGESLEGISYGIVNVESGSTFSVGVGNTDHSTNKFQLSNGELNVDGAGSQMIIGSNSCFLLMGEWGFSNSSAAAGEYPLFTGICYTEKINVTDGGKITNEAETGLYSLYLGEDFLAANTNVEISVSGKDDSGNASTFDLTSSSNAHIGTKSGYDEAYVAYGNNYIIKDGGTMDVTISASEGGEFKITANGIFVCADNYETYLVSGGSEKDVGHSYGIDVKLSAESGGSLELNSVSGGTVLLAAGSPYEADLDDDGVNDYKNTLTIKADGTLTDEEGNVTASSVTISGGDIYTNFGDAGEGADNVYVTITATNGGTIALSAASVEGTGKGVISFGMNTAVKVEGNSSLTTDGTSVSFESGSSISVDATSTWTDTGSVIVATGATMSLAGTVTVSDLVDEENTGTVLSAGTITSQGAITVSGGTLDVKSISVTKADGSESTTDGVLAIKGGETTVETLTIGNESLGASFSMTDGTLNVTWTASEEVPTGGFSIASAASANFSGGTVNVSTAIANDGTVTVSDSIVFVLNDSLKVEGTSATYAIIINGEGGTIEGWGELGTSNFVYGDLTALDTNVVLDLTTDGYVTLLYKEEGVTINYDYETPWQRGEHGLSGYEKAEKALYYFRAMHIEIDEGASVGGFTLQDLTNEEGDYAISSKNVYITGSGKDSSKLTITDINVSNTSAGYYAFIVENATVVINGTDVKVSELGMNLCIGTMDSAELQITGGAQVSTSGVWSTIGSNMATGTLTISGEGSSLTNAQINIGMATTSLSGGANEENGDGYYFGRFVQTDEHYYKVIDALASDTYQPTDGSYGIVNVKEGGTWTISGNDTSNSRLQLSNGEINIDGAGSSLIFGKNSSLAMGNMTSSLTDSEGKSVTLTVSETLKVTNGGTVKAADGVTLYEFYIGRIYSGSNGEAAIYVDGEGSTFDVSAEWVYFGMKNETTAGGTEDVKVSASNGGTIKISGSSSASAFYVGYTSSSSGQADQMNISLTAESGGTITLENDSSYSTFFGRNTATEEASGIDVLATGEGSSVNIISTSKAIWTNYSTSNFNTSFVAEDGGKITFTSGSDIVFGYGSGSAKITADGGTVSISGADIIANNENASESFYTTFTATNGGKMELTATSSSLGAEGIHLNSNSSIIVEKGSTLTTSSAKTVLFESGSSISVDATSTWTDYGTIEVKAGASMDLAGTVTVSDLVDEENTGTVLSAGTITSQGAITVSDGTLSATSISVTKADSSGDYDGTFTISGGTVSVETLTIGNESLGGTFSITSGEIDAKSFSIASAASANFSGGIVDVATSIADSGSVTVTNEVIFVLSEALKDGEDDSGNTYIVIATDNTTIDTWKDLSSNNFIFDDGSTLKRSVVNLETDGVVTITSEEESATLIWNGSDSLHAWDKDVNDKDWKNGPIDDSFYMGDNVIFNETASNHDVTIGETLIAGTITVGVSDEAEEGTTIEYEFDFSNGASLEGESLSVGDGASLTVTGDGSLEIDGETDIAGDMTVTGGAEANFDDGVTIEDTGSLTVTSDEDTGASGSVNVSGDLDVNGSLSVEDGSLTITGTTDEDTGETTGGTLDVSGEASITGGTVTADKVEVTENGTLDFEGGTLNTGDLTIASDENATLKGGNLNIGSLTVSEGDSVTFGDGLTVGVYGDEGLTLDGDLNVNLDGSVGFDTSNGDIEIEGTISDSTDESGDKVTGSLTKTGSGTLTLDGENDYSGGTTIDEGTIDADNTSALGTGEVDIHKGATLKVHSHDDSGNPDEFTNSTTGEGTLEIVEGDIHFTEDVGVQNVIVDKDATLDGDTTLTHSDASLDLKGTLEIDVGSEEVHISDSGTVILEDTSKLVLDDADSLGAGDSFVIVDGGTVTGDIDHFLGTDGTLSELSNDYAIIYDTSNGLSVSIENTGTRSIPNMRLHDGLYSDFIAAVITEEDMTIVAGIQGTGDVSSNPIARELLNGNVSRAVEMLNTLAPNDYAAMIAMPTTAYHNDVSSIDKRLAAVRAMPFSEDENARWGYFAQADGTFAENDDANDTPTFDFQLYGVLAGADYRMSNTLTVGVALGYDHEHAKLHNSGGRIDGDDVRLTIYAGTQITDLVYANVGAQIGYGHYEARRHTVMGRASGETDGYNAGVFADVGMDLPLSEKHGISARPYVGLAYLRSFVSGFDDSLFDIGSFNNDSLVARIGLGVFWDLGGVSLGIDTSFSHDFCGEEIDDMSATYRATGSKFSMMAECLPEDVFSVGPVVSVGISEGISAFAGYSFQAGSNEYIGHNVYIGVRASF